MPIFHFAHSAAENTPEVSTNYEPNTALIVIGVSIVTLVFLYVAFWLLTKNSKSADKRTEV